MHELQYGTRAVAGKLNTKVLDVRSPSSKMKNLETASQLEVWEYSLTVPHLINWSRGLSDQRIVVKSTICTHWRSIEGEDWLVLL